MPEFYAHVSKRDVGAILEKFDLNGSYFIQLGIFIVMFLVLSRVYFRPFQQLLQNRNQKMVKDRKEAEELILKADQKLNEYTSLITEAKKNARSELEAALTAARMEEIELFNTARKEVKNINQLANAEFEEQKNGLLKTLVKDVDRLAQEFCDRLISNRPLEK